MANIGSGRIVTKCDQCGEWDDHPKHHVGVFHPGASAREYPTRHHDCVDEPTRLDILAGTHGVHPLITAKIFAACAEGTRGGDLLAFIGDAHMSDHGDATMSTTGMDEAMADAVVTALLPTTGTATIGTKTITAPVLCQFDSVITTSGTSASTQWVGGSYPTDGVSVGTNWAGASGGSRASSAAVTVTGAPATEWAGNELWDSSATKSRTFYGAITGGSKTVNIGDTATIPSGSLSAAISI